MISFFMFFLFLYFDDFDFLFVGVRITHMILEQKTVTESTEFEKIKTLYYKPFYIGGVYF